MSIAGKAAIIGAGCSDFAEHWSKSAEDLVVDAVLEAYAAAGIAEPRRQIDAVFAGSLYAPMGPVHVTEALKLYKPTTMVYNYCATGTEALRAAVMAVACGAHDTVLAVGFDKPKDRGVSGPSVNIRGVRDLPETPAGWFALCAAPYFARFGAGREDLARIAVKNHHNGTLAPKSFLKKEISVEEALGARMISWPFGLYDCAAQTDGAAAVIVTRRDLARNYHDRAVVVRAVASASAPHPHTDPTHDFLRWKPTVAAAEAAYTIAGISHPMRAIDVAQLHDCFTLTELLSYEDLGFIAKGAAREHIAAGTFALGGELPVNTDGGLKAFGHPTAATGLRMIYENVLQLRGRAGARQVPGATTALSHNIGGYPTGCAVSILSRE
jgi:acetyl-CoA C-acetyltransferase